MRMNGDCGDCNCDDPRAHSPRELETFDSHDPVVPFLWPEPKIKLRADGEWPV